MSLRPRPRLVYRLYVIGVVQLLLVAVAAVAIGYAMAKSPPRWDMQSITAQLTPLFGNAPRLKRELELLRQRHGLLLSVYDDERHLLGTNVEPPLHPPRFGPFGPAPGGAPPFGKHTAIRVPPPHTYTAISVQGHEGVLVARFEHPRPSLWLPSLTLVAGLLVVGVGALLTARWIAVPLQRLSRASVALGEGDLHARTGLTRSDEIGEVARAFDHMADRIQALRHAEKELLANVAHELRTPLSRIRVALEIASEGDAEAVHSSLGEIAVDLTELEALIEDVLNATRFELTDGKAALTRFALHLQSVSPGEIAERAAERFRNRHAGRPFSLECALDLPQIEADSVLVRRVLDNLLENAHKYSPVTDTPIELRVTSDAGFVRFAVHDGGMGIAPVDLPHVFDAFFRGERSRSRGTGGVGLGLTLAKRIVEAHAGNIVVTSAYGEGTVVVASIPTQPNAA
jgi:two-component system, OmpR family, sensor kinase